MRFITEFELDSPYTESNLEWHKFRYIATEMGLLIEKSFGLNHRGCTTLNPSDSVKERFFLEIEAFPMDKWIEFKDRLMAHLHYCDEHDELPDALAVLRLIKELEFFNSNETKKPG